MKKAVALPAYNRPEYFARCVNHLAQNTNIKDWHVHAFLDGGPAATQKENLQILDRSGLEFDVTQHTRNLNCGLNLIDCKTRLFDEGYDKVVVIEDDVLISSGALSYLDNVDDWLDRNYDNAGLRLLITVHNRDAFHRCGISEFNNMDEARPYQRQIISSSGHMGVYLVNRSLWNTIKDNLFEYRSIIAGIDYRRVRRHTDAIYPLFKRLLERGMDKTFDRAIPLPPGRRAWLQAVWNKLMEGRVTPSQDNATKLCLISEGFVGVFPVVNRAINIGSVGLHASPEHFEKRKLSTMRLYDFPDDHEIREFEMKA
jgi:glycosyltransferase involved in cell wall biosynthesis